MNALMTWEEVCADPNLQELPYKVETDRFGRIVMSPTHNRHSINQSAVMSWLQRQRPDWVVAVEFAIETGGGVKVPDVIAMPPERHPTAGNDAACPLAPDVCVEVLSRSNDPAEIAEKRGLLSAKGCMEFWVCALDGTMTFQDAAMGQSLGRSRLFPEFPASVLRR